MCVKSKMISIKKLLLVKNNLVNVMSFMLGYIDMIQICFYYLIYEKKRISEKKMLNESLTDHISTWVFGYD